MPFRIINHCIFKDSTPQGNLFSSGHFVTYCLDFAIILDCFYCLLRPLTASTKLACTASPLSQPTPFQRHLLEASISVKPSRTSWKEICTPVISSCAHTPVLPTCPSHVRNNQVRCFKPYSKYQKINIKIRVIV